MPKTTYIIRDINPAVWREVKARAALEGLTIRAVLLRLLAEYATGA
jgi:hypothetical protein